MWKTFLIPGKKIFAYISYSNRTVLDLLKEEVKNGLLPSSFKVQLVALLFVFLDSSNFFFCFLFYIVVPSRA